MRILIAEDEKDLNGILASRLKSEHYSVDSCYDGEEACAYLDSAEYDAVILDIMMPKLDGLSVLKRMRNGNDGTPVLLLTAKDSIEDRVMGLDAGANDYLVKPFAFEELLARIRVLLRKPAETPKTCYKVAGSGSAYGYAAGDKGRRGDPPVGKRVRPFEIHGSERGNRAVSGQAGAASLEL